MNKTKCKYCCQEIEEKNGVWLDGGFIIKSLCTLAPNLLHEPDDDEEEIRDQMYLISYSFEETKHAS